ncbi:hypothetical protein T01_11359 [Trichinella spiralis]|uniref:Uncharacterized protein n=1 Tax=Trichinella spiralis TaxID=6334 RepID=A0A0V0Z4J6_TRISP|nr:hypothetical protein T01_11359 [Trichinella spiralis]
MFKLKPQKWLSKTKIACYTQLCYLSHEFCET